MKYNFIAVCLCLYSYSSMAQLIGITPNQGVRNQSLTTTITSNGLFIQSSSPSGNINSIQLRNGGDIIPVFEIFNGWWYNVEVVHPDTAIAYINIPLFANPGTYDLEVFTGNLAQPWINTVMNTLPAAFTVLPPDGNITGTVFDDLNKNGVKDAGEPGIPNRNVRINPYYYNVSTDVNGDFSFPANNGTYSIILNPLSTERQFLTTPNDTLIVTVNNGDATGNDFGVRTAMTSITPDSAYHNLPSTHVIVSDYPIFTLGANAYGNITGAVIYSTPNLNVSPSSFTVIDSFTVEVTLNIPFWVTTADSLDIRLQLTGPYPGFHFLRDKLHIGTPDGYISGNIYHDLNENGIKDTGEAGLTRYVKINPNGFILTADASGNYSCPVPNGNYYAVLMQTPGQYMFLTSAADSFMVVINNNNSSGHNFGLKHALFNITPTTGYKGVSTPHQITSSEPIFNPGLNPNGNIISCLVYGSPYVFVDTTSITIIDSFTVVININIPANAAVADSLDIRVVTTGLYQGNHFLKQQFNIVTPPAFISGRVFFDQNQNKLSDVGEPGVPAGKVVISPDGSTAFSDNSGNYLLGSLGGPQTLAYMNNLSGLVLFTDSASYTFSVTGNIVNKDFGLISTNPDYSIQVKTLQMLRRCNTEQNANFKVRNTSNIYYNATVWMKFDTLLTFISSPLPTVISNDTIYWNLTGIAPYSEIPMQAKFLLPGAGTSVSLTVGAISLDGTNTAQLSDSISAGYNITCAWDPNDKQVTPPGIFSQNYTLMTDTLEYLIRFQNTGNDTAFKVVVLDTLDSNLNFSTFEILGSSHSMQTEMESNGAIKFVFENILLADSNVNEAESHGYIQYRILANNGLTDGTPVYNTAHIFFDFNPAVVTNTTLNTLVYVLPVGIDDDAATTNHVLVYPNPFSQSATLLFDNPSAEKFKLSIYEITGKSVTPDQTTTGNRFLIEKNKLSSGIYFFNLTNTVTNISRTGKFIIE